MKTFTKRELAVLKRAADILYAKTPIGSDLYEHLSDCGCQPSTALGALEEMIQCVENGEGLTPPTDTA